MTTSATVLQIIADLCMVDEVQPSDNLTRSLNFDSLDFTELAIALDEQFPVEWIEDELENCVTVADVIALVESKVGESVNV